MDEIGAESPDAIARAMVFAIEAKPDHVDVGDMRPAQRPGRAFAAGSFVV